MATALSAAIARREELFARARHDAIEAIPAELRVSRTSNPADAVSPLATVREAIEAVGRNYAQELGAYSWLFWLRRLPPAIFAGQLSSTGPYDQALAEALSSTSAFPESFSTSRVKSVIPLLSRRQSEILIMMCGLAACLATLHSVIRRAGKGQEVRWFTDDLPWTEPDRTLDKMIRLYDNRVLTGGEIGGTRSFDFHPFFAPGPPVPARQVALLVNQQKPDASVPFWQGTASAPERVFAGPGRYLAGGMTTGELRRLLAMSRTQENWPPDQLISLISFLRIMAMFVFNEDFGQGLSLPAVGYLVLPTEMLEPFIANLLPVSTEDLLDLFPGSVPLTSQKVISDVSALEASLWPLIKGPVLRHAGDQTLVDIDAATQIISRMLTVPSHLGGSLVNARAAHFEQFVQSVIDKSPWAPAASLRAYWQKTLRLNGKGITDIDAIAAKDSRLLLVSCKSVPFTPAYDSGSYGAVRNVRTLLEKSDAEWNSRLSILRENPKGDNYDLRGYELTGSVCTPHVAFVHEQQTRVAVTGEGGKILRATCSVAELEDFLRT